jgi:hypothetical protein
MTTTPEFDSLTLDILGAVRGQPSAADEIHDAIRYAAAQVRRDDVASTEATVTAKFVISKVGDDNIAVIMDSLTTRLPKPKRYAIIAVATGAGDLVTAQHRQRDLPLDNVTRLETKGGA